MGLYIKGQEDLHFIQKKKNDDEIFFFDKYDDEIKLTIMLHGINHFKYNTNGLTFFY